MGLMPATRDRQQEHALIATHAPALQKYLVNFHRKLEQICRCFKQKKHFSLEAVSLHTELSPVQAAYAITEAIARSRFLAADISLYILQNGLSEIFQGLEAT